MSIQPQKPAKQPHAVAVIDIGITHLKLLLIDQQQQVVASFRANNQPLSAPPYLHMDIEMIWHWLLHALQQAAEIVAIDALIPCTHGSAVALIDDNDELVLPVMHYEAPPPQSVVDGYTAITPEFAEVLAPVNPGGLTMARQFFWQQSLFPEAFARTQKALLYPQYWAWRLSGIAAAEVTSLGAQTHLWAPQQRDYASLADTRGWRQLFPPLANAWDTLGMLKPEISRQTGLPVETPVLCGIHDSNANYLRYLAAGWEDFTLLSSGTWMINFNRAYMPDKLVPEYDTATNTDVYARPVSCSRFMGGREYGMIAKDVTVPPTMQELQNIIAQQTLALPSFSDSGGPFPGTGGKGRIIGPKPEGAAAWSALATLYTALMAKQSLIHIGTGNDIIIDGTFAGNTLFCQLFAALHPQRKVWSAQQQDGSAQGAALLWRLAERSEPVELSLSRAEPFTMDGLDDYAQRWLEHTKN